VGDAEPASTPVLRDHSKVWLILAVAAAAIPLLLYVLLGTSARYVADDFCTASHIPYYGFVEAQKVAYNTLYGRFTFIFLISLLEVAGQDVARVWPLITVLAWIGALTWCVHQGLRLFEKKVPLVMSALFGVFLTQVYLATLPDQMESFYWLTGNVTYSVAPVVLFFGLGSVFFLLRKRFPPLFAAVAALITCFLAAASPKLTSAGRPGSAWQPPASS
jgi:hypothetical protein